MPIYTSSLRGGSAAIAVQDETVTLTTTPTSMNFTGAGVTATTVGNAVSITIPGGGTGSALAVQDEGVALTAGATVLNFAGAGVTATASGTTVSVTIPGGGTGSAAATPVSYSASRTLSPTDAGRQLRIDTTAAAVVLTIPADIVTSFSGSEGFWASVVAGLNPVTFVAGSGTVLLNPNSAAATVAGANLFAIRTGASTFAVSN